MQRLSDGLYWDGTAWAAGPAWMAATAGWTLPFAPVNGESYTIQSRATDAAANVQSTPGVGSFSYHLSSPDSSVLTSGLYGPAGWSGAITGTALSFRSGSSAATAGRTGGTRRSTPTPP